jgi:hypothetical protein
VNPERENDWLDAALDARPAATPPSDFTQRVMQRVTSPQPTAVLSGLLPEQGLSVGLAFAVFGLCLILDMEGLMSALDRAIRTPEAAAAVAVGSYVVWLLTKKEPEAECFSTLHSGSKP